MSDFRVNYERSAGAREAGMDRKAGFEKHLDFKMEELGYGPDDYEFVRDDGLSVRMTRLSDSELREVVRRLAPDFNAVVKGGALVFRPVKHEWTVASELVMVAKDVMAARKLKYRGYTIEESGINYYVTDPSGHRAFGEVPASVETAKKWIDWDIHEKGAKG